MKILYIISKFILFPGAYIRGFWEHLACKLLRIPVEPIGYLRPDEASGHAEHSLARSPGSAWFMVFFPGFMNFNIGFPMWIVGIQGLFYLGTTIYDSTFLFLYYLICYYVGLSFMCSLFPIIDDILALWDQFNYSGAGLYKEKTSTAVFGIIVLPWAVITRIGSFLERYCINFLLGIAITLIYLFKTKWPSALFYGPLRVILQFGIGKIIIAILGLAGAYLLIGILVVVLQKITKGKSKKVKASKISKEVAEDEEDVEEAEDESEAEEADDEEESTEE